MEVSPEHGSICLLRLICREGSVGSLLTELALHKVDLIIADGPIPSSVNVRVFNHPLGDCGIIFSTAKLARKLNKYFPQNLNGMPLLLPGEMTVVRSRLLEWLNNQHIYPRIVGEFDDSALMKAFGQTGAGVFIAPTPITEEVKKQSNVVIIGKLIKYTNNSKLFQ